MKSPYTGIGFASTLRALIATAAILATGAHDARSEEVAALLDQAITAYEHAMATPERDARVAAFGNAERLFEAVVERGAENADIQTNLGSAALQAEHLGKAILAYRRALLLEPRLARARQNLEHARRLLPKAIPTPATTGGLFDSFFFWHHSASRSLRAKAAAVCFALSILGLASSIYWRTPVPRVLGMPFALAWIGLLASLVLDPANDAHLEAVVVGRDVQARAADSINAPTLFGEPLPAGTEVRILEDRHPWIQIELANGRNAWIKDSATQRLRAE